MLFWYSKVQRSSEKFKKIGKSSHGGIITIIRTSNLTKIELFHPCKDFPIFWNFSELLWTLLYQNNITPFRYLVALNFIKNHDICPSYTQSLSVNFWDRQRAPFPKNPKHRNIYKLMQCCALDFFRRNRSVTVPHFVSLGFTDKG